MTGLLVGLTGVGGGALMTPILLLVFGVAPMAAVGTDLWFATITKVFATRVHGRHGLIAWDIVLRLWMGSLTASAATLVWVKFQPIDESDTSLLRMTIAVAVIGTALSMLAQERIHSLTRHLRAGEDWHFKRTQALLTVVAGALLGVLVTLTSIGAGALGAIFLAYLYPMRLTPPRLIATDIVHAIPLALFAGLGHLFIGNVDFGLLGNMLLGSVPAVFVGAHLSARLPHSILRAALVSVLLAIGVKLLL